MVERTPGESDAEMAALVERNGFALVSAFSAWGRARVHDGPDTLHVLSDVPDPAFNMVVRAGLSDETVDVAIAAIQASATSRDTPLAWLIGPESTPPSLGARLERHGFHREEDVLAMSLDVRTLRLPRPAPGLAVHEVDDARALATWAHIVTAGFALPSWAEGPLRDMTDALLRTSSTTFHAFVVRRHGDPIGAASLFVTDGSAGVYNVATLEHARGHGAATAATVAALRLAVEDGCEHAVLQASPAAASVYRRLGFQVPGRIEVRAWTPDRQVRRDRDPD